MSLVRTSGVVMYTHDFVVQSLKSDYPTVTVMGDSITGTGILRGVASLLVGLKKWVQDHGIDYILIPGVLMLARLFFFLLSSVGIYSVLYLYLMPRALVKEPVYFDYSSAPPTATLNLLSAHKQWEYVSGGLKASSSKGDTSVISSQFLRSDFAYSVDVEFTLAKSRRNYEIGKFMATVHMIDSTGDLIARSSRPVVVPYQSSVTLFLDSVCKFPCRIVGLCEQNEVVSVHVPMMTEYREPKVSATESIDLTLSSDRADIGAVEVTIMPALRGIVYFMWYFPIITGLLSISALMGTHLAIYGAYLMITFTFKYLSEFENKNGDDVVAESTDGSGEYGLTLETEDTEVGPQSATYSERQDAGATLNQASSTDSTVTPGSFDEHEELDFASSDNSSALAAQRRRGHEIEAVLISESSTDNPNLRRRLTARVENADDRESRLLE